MGRGVFKFGLVVDARLGDIWSFSFSSSSSHEQGREGGKKGKKENE